MGDTFKAIGHEGERLDRALTQLLPQTSLRAARRLIARGMVLLNGCPVSQGRKLGPRDEITVSTPAEDVIAASAPLLERQGDYLFYYKKAGIHTAFISGSDEASIEKGLPEGKLLQRLDKPTAGIVLAATNDKAAMAWRQAERAGLCEKWYLAITTGRMDDARWLTTALRCNGARRVLPGRGEAGKDCRTWVQPLDGDTHRTLVAARINRGQRHQIRAHLAICGHPLQGDSLYGGGPGKLVLEQCAVSFPGHTFAYVDAQSPLRELFPMAVARWLRERG